MADGYARISGKPGVALVITGPGLTNTLTPMAQARADSILMLVLSGVNALPDLGTGLGLLHELPDQQAVAREVAVTSERIEKPVDLAPMLDREFSGFATERLGPAHIEIPLDVARFEYSEPVATPPDPPLPEADGNDIAKAAGLLQAASRPLILAGGGTRRAHPELQRLARRPGGSDGQRTVRHASPLARRARQSQPRCSARFDGRCRHSAGAGNGSRPDQLRIQRNRNSPKDQFADPRGHLPVPTDAARGRTSAPCRRRRDDRCASRDPSRRPPQSRRY